LPCGGQDERYYAKNKITKRRVYTAKRYGGVWEWYRSCTFLAKYLAGGGIL